MWKLIAAAIDVAEAVGRKKMTKEHYKIKKIKIKKIQMKKVWKRIKTNNAKRCLSVSYCGNADS